ncbi:uncharacterized protein LOC111869952 [Cryptotermes secundus]|uniref:uncharacterized protein LOC111869952 n=1 Tax=Cryptotermes secundus TaxID=105785 RepID=UPI001454D7AE|nr:uncharacterized protein LOC111869952 [Cryptotermes secundus]
MIRTAATNYLKEQLISLKTLPTEAELKSLQDQRRQEMSARIQQEKQLAVLEAHQAEMQRRRDSPQHRDLIIAYHLVRRSLQIRIAYGVHGWGSREANVTCTR